MAHGYVMRKRDYNKFHKFTVWSSDDTLLFFAMKLLNCSSNQNDINEPFKEEFLANDLRRVLTDGALPQV